MADVSSTLRLWSATAASNLPAGTTTIGTGLDDNLREIQAVIRKYMASAATPMASATTVDLATADGYYVSVTGVTTITGLGTESAGISYLLVFAGVLTFTHNSTSLILPGGANITTAVGDAALMISLGSGNWKCVSYQRYSLSEDGVKNRIINGNMNIAQRGTSFGGIAFGSYSLDRWLFTGGTTTAINTLSQQSDVPSSNEHQNSLRSTVTTADAAVGAGDLVVIEHRIEGYNIRDLIGKTFSLSFWVRGAKTGVHCVAFRNSGTNRSWISEYTINAIDTWEYKTVTVTGGLITAGTWNYTTGVGLAVSFVLAGGSTYQSTKDSWLTTNSYCTASVVNELDTIGNIFAITGVQLEVGSVATTFEQRSFGLELALCLRYYWRWTAGLNQKFCAGFENSTNLGQGAVPFPVPMRIAPSAVEQSGTVGDYSVYNTLGNTVCTSVPTYQSGTLYNCDLRFTTAAVLTSGQGVQLSGQTSSAYLGFSAEL